MIGPEGPGAFAAVGNDGMRPVVWGTGTTEEAALADARLWLDGEDQDLEVHPIDEYEMVEVLAGDVSWPPSGRESAA